MSKDKEELDKEIIAAAEKMHELCYTMEYCEDCPLIDISCKEGNWPMGWDISKIKEEKSPR